MINKNRQYVLWRRVSTKQQGESELGLEAQTAIAEYFMHGEPEKVFTDVYSGTKLKECRNLQSAIRYCRETGYLLVIAKTDRIRNTVDGLSIIDDMGEGNVCFCDLQTTDRTVLTMMFAMWERQAIMGRINTKLALNERIKQRDRDGFWVSKAGNRCTHLGREKGFVGDNTAAVQAKVDAAILWRENSKAVKFAQRKKDEGWKLQQIVDELGQLFDDNVPEDAAAVNPYGTPTGCKPSKGTVSKWLRESNPLTLAV